MERGTTHGPVVAGTFYPADAETLRDTVSRLLGQAQPPNLEGRLRGLIVPHAGYIYSGPVAATAYALLESGTFDEVILIGPSHFERFEGVASLDASRWRTPLGAVPLGEMPAAAGVAPRKEAYRREHSLEVQLPFLQVTVNAFSLVPLLTGFVEAHVVTDVLDDLVTEGSLLIVSTDLSHYEDYETARRLDRATADAVVLRDAEGLRRESACGLTGLQAAVGLAQGCGWKVQLLDLRNSADTAGSRRRVVGYGAFAIVQP